MKPILVGVFGLVGIYSRYLINEYLRPLNATLPWHTMTINLVGCFLIGVVYFLGAERNIISEDLRISIMVGLLGGFTTFSAFGLESFLLLKGGQVGMALFYVGASTFGGIFLCMAGYKMAAFI